MYQAFLAIIAFMGALYALFTKQLKISLGLLIYSAAFILLMPALSKGIESDFLYALAMILFVLGTFAIVWKKKLKEDESTNKDEESKEKSKEEEPEDLNN